MHIDDLTGTPAPDFPLGMLAAMHNQVVLEVQNLEHQFKTLSLRLEKFSRAHVLAIVGGLQTLPEYHPATVRFESLAHLAALRCVRKRSPNAAQIREWLNDILLPSAVGDLEDPVEDVFTSNVVTWWGNIRIFEGTWETSDFGLQAILNALRSLGQDAHLKALLPHIRALLLLSEELAGRSKVHRYVMCESAPRIRIQLSTPHARELAARVRFSPQDLERLDIKPSELDTFVFCEEDREKLATETVGYSSLERRPLLQDGSDIVVALPTAMSVAIRRLILERASEHRWIGTLQDALTTSQIADVLSDGVLGWSVKPFARDKPQRPATPQFTHETFGTFDDGHFGHIIFVAEDLEDCLKSGLQEIRMIGTELAEHVRLTAQDLAVSEDYRGGITFVVFGGIGRGFMIEFEKSVPNWYHVAIGLSDFLLLPWSSHFSALRAYKLLAQQHALRQRNIHFRNPNGFLNLYAYWESNNFSLVPREMPIARGGNVMIAANFLAPMRKELRQVLDRHLVALAGDGAWREVQRESTTFFFREIERLPLYVSVASAIAGKLVGCTETSVRAWWLNCEERPADKLRRSLVQQIWNAGHNWLCRLAPLLERALPQLPEGSIGIDLVFSDISSWSELQPDPKAEYASPNVRVSAGRIIIDAHCEYLRSFARPENIGDRLLVLALARGANMLAAGILDDHALDNLVAEAVPDQDSRFLHFTVARSFREMIAASFSLPQARLIQPEDDAWVRIGVANAITGSSPLSEFKGREETSRFIHSVVDLHWGHIRDSLQPLDRRDLIVRALLNNEAIAEDRMIWSRTARAVIALHKDRDDIFRAAARREGDRSAAALASRVLIEMAVCTSPTSGGRRCDVTEFDRLLAAIYVMVETASFGDALFQGYIQPEITIHPNGNFSFAETFNREVLFPYIKMNADEGFEHAARIYERHFERDQVGTDNYALEDGFDLAIQAEFGVSLLELRDFLAELERIAWDRKMIFLECHASELRRLLQERLSTPIERLQKLIEVLTLRPRARWDELKPERARARDWYPWRYGRRLSLVKRPIVQLTRDEDPMLIVAPTIMGDTFKYILRAYDGRLAEDLFDSAEMRKWIGHAAHKEGATFNRRIQSAFYDARISARAEVNMTEFGADAKLGDIDVLAWDEQSGIIFVVECKRLKFAKTIAEIAEQLSDFKGAPASASGARDELRKHLDRIAHINANPGVLERVTAIPQSRVRLRSILVTEQTVPMQFMGEIVEKVDGIYSEDALVSSLSDVSRFIREQ